MTETTSNKSIGQIISEIQKAKNEALRRPHRFEVENHTCVGDGDGDNLLSDVVMVKQLGQRSGTQSIVHLKDTIEYIFRSFPAQYETLGLYYGAGFTLDEIARRKGDSKGNCRTTRNRAVARLKKGLSPDEFDSIKWALGIRPELDATPRVDDSEYDNCRSRFAPSPVYLIAGASPNVHPPTKNLPVPRMVIWKEQQEVTT